MPHAKQCTRCEREEIFQKIENLRPGWSRVRTCEWPADEDVQCEDLPEPSTDRNIGYKLRNEAISRNEERVAAILVRREAWLCPDCTEAYRVFRSVLHANISPGARRATALNEAKEILSDEA